MFFEHCMADDSETHFKPSNANQHTTPIAEWEFIVGKDGVNKNTWQIDLECVDKIPADKMPQIMGAMRKVQSLKGLMVEERVVNAKLTEWEVCSFHLQDSPSASK